MGNITSDGQLATDELKFLPKNHNEFPDLLLRSGDLLFNRTNSAELVGKSAVYMGSPLPCSFASYLIRVVLVPGCHPRFVAACINSSYGRAWIKAVVNQQVGQANVNGTKLQAFAIPLPPLDEQERIVAAVDEVFSNSQAAQTTVVTDLVRADRLRQSILKRAFDGKLVPQDPNDEPASVVLERTRAQRATQIPTDQRGRSRRQKTKAQSAQEAK
jgi:type I restriction enzyme S subunit